jgi:hypothetical protein
MVRISGYGQSGPYAERPGYGAICEAVGGVRHMTGDPDRPPARVALATTDYLSSVYAAFGAVTAIHAGTRPAKARWWTWRCTKPPSRRWSPSCPPLRSWARCRCAKGPNLPSMAPNSLYPTATAAGC